MTSKYLINPTGRFVIGGPQGDCGLTGRKIIVDTYGGAAPHGGGAFSGKDPSKVDRSAAYAARYVAKNIVAAGLAKRCTVQISYAIGVAKPTSILVDTHGTGKVSDEKLTALVRKHFDLRPKGIVQMLDLLRPIYGKTPPTATSAARSPSSPGKPPTRRPPCAPTPVSDRPLRPPDLPLRSRHMASPCNRSGRPSPNCGWQPIMPAIPSCREALRPGIPSWPGST